MMMTIFKMGWTVEIEITKLAKTKNGSFKFVYQGQTYWALNETRTKELLILEDNFETLQKKLDNRIERVKLLDDYNEYLKSKLSKQWQKDLQIKIFGISFGITAGVAIAEALIIGLLYNTSKITYINRKSKLLSVVYTPNIILIRFRIVCSSTRPKIYNPNTFCIPCVFCTRITHTTSPIVI